MPVTIDGPNRILAEDAAGASNTVDVAAIYSAWKAWALLADNAKFLPAFRVVGGDPTVGGDALGATFFLTNGWQIRPAESDHLLTLRGNLFVDGGGDPIANTVGTFRVRVAFQQTNLIDRITTGSGVTSTDVTDIAAAVATGRAVTDAQVALVWQLLGFDPDNPATTTVPDGDGAGTITIGSVTLDVVRSGTTTTITLRT